MIVANLKMLFSYSPGKLPGTS